MEIVNGSIVLGTKSCYCNDGTRFDITWCKNRTKARGLHECEKKTCPNNKTGFSQMHEISRRVVPCENCKGGTVEIKEDYTDYITLPQDFPIKVVRQNRANTWNENYLGMGCLHSCTDYGTANKSTDEEVIAGIRASRHSLHTQACKIVRSKDDLRVADFLVVAVTTNGYALKAGFND